MSRRYKPGDTITNGYKTYAMRNSGMFHYVSSGNHAKYHLRNLDFCVTIFTNHLENGFKTLSDLLSSRKEK